MGEIRAHNKVLLLVAVCSRYEHALAWAGDRLTEMYGATAKVSKPFAFTQTDYYLSSMGTELKKQFLTFAQRIDPGGLPDIKIATNRLETEYAEKHSTAEKRPLNLDPGYVSQAKLVLASTKDHAHRIYLGKGIYAEITLHYHKKQWQKNPWTYPDYQTDEYGEFFTECRMWLRAKRLDLDS